MSKKLIILICGSILLSSCSNQNSESQLPLSVDFLINTHWTNQPMDEFPECIDTLSFHKDDIGYFYQCEHDWKLSIDYHAAEDTLVFIVIDEGDHLQGELEIIEVSRYKMVRVQSGLKVVDIAHRWQDIWNQVDPEILKNKTYKKIE